MIKALFLCALCWATTVSAFGQEALKLGPFGKPILVMDEAGNWSIPINLYSDSDVDVFIPDITTAGWISWHATQFRQTGIFLVSVFSFYKNDHLCRKDRIPVGHETDPKLLEACAALRYQRKLVSIDTRGGTITVLEAILMGRDALPDPQSLTKIHSTFPLAKAAPKEAYDRMLEIVDREINDYKGLTIEEAIANDNKVVLNMMHQAYTPASDSGCPGRTPEQMANWHNTGCPPLNQTCGYNAQGWFLCSTPAPAEVVRPAQAARDQSASGNGSRSYSGTVRNTTAGISATFEITLREQEAKLSGCAAVHRPLYGSGELRGSRDGAQVSFDVESPSEVIKFTGHQKGPDITGSYDVYPRTGGNTRQRGTFELHRQPENERPTSLEPPCPDDSTVR